MSESYRIVRNYFNYREFDNEVVATGLTLEEAQEWCRDPETSSRTCKKPQNVKRTEEKGPWFDGYEVEKTRRRDIDNINSPLSIWTRETKGIW